MMFFVFESGVFHRMTKLAPIGMNENDQFFFFQYFVNCLFVQRKPKFSCAKPDGIAQNKNNSKISIFFHYFKL